jgi:iron complex outermembrane receptor protein
MVAKEATPWQLHLSVLNLLNTDYRDYLGRFRYFASEPGINFILRLQVPFDIFKHINKRKKNQ